MISDNQRREVARRLLSLDGSTAGEIARRMNLLPFEVLGDILVTALGLFVALGEAGLDAEGADGIWALLAELIDRPMCEAIEHGRPDESNVCKSCSRCSYGWFECIHDKPYSFCPNCGAELSEKECK